MKKILINTKQNEEHRIICTQGDYVVSYEAYPEGNLSHKGNVYQGRIVRVEGSLEAAFVDYGGNKNGFLPFNEIRNELLLPKSPQRESVASRIDVGRNILVQVEHDERESKGAHLTTYLSLPGYYLVLITNGRAKNAISKRASANVRSELQEKLSQLSIPEGMSVIMRTAGLDKSIEELSWDLESYLLPLWQGIQSASEQSNSRTLIYSENSIIVRALRDHANIKEDLVCCDTPDIYEQVREFVALIAPDKLDNIQYHDKSSEFINDKVERQIQEIFSREVTMPSGGVVVFDSTEALVAIDVNSAKSRGQKNLGETALRTNLEAAEVIAHQLKLRDLGGLIVIDFIDMKANEHRERVEQHLREHMSGDKARHRICPISRLGLLELSRQRLSNSVVEIHTSRCEACNGSGRIRHHHSLALSALRELQVVAGKNPQAQIIVYVPELVGIYLLNDKRTNLRRIEDNGRCAIIVIPDATKVNHYKIEVNAASRGTLEQYGKARQQEIKKLTQYAERKKVVTEEEPVLSGFKPTSTVPSRRLWSRLAQWITPREKEESPPPNANGGAPRKNTPSNRGDRNRRGGQHGERGERAAQDQSDNRGGRSRSRQHRRRGPKPPEKRGPAPQAGANPPPESATSSTAATTTPPAEKDQPK